ncbi:MAG TPA: hypothetical protein VD767_11245, partial [Thermomicrobiales bacterium]|nr:hypothetical protein [Thermomicrobiales bacterium]
MSGEKFDTLSRAVAEPRSRRGVIGAMIATVAATLLVDQFLDRNSEDGGSTAEAGDEINEYPISCGECVAAVDKALEISGVAYEESCSGIVMGLLKCPGLSKIGCIAITAGVCVMSKTGTGNLLGNSNGRSICSSNLVGNIPFVIEGGRPPCRDLITCDGAFEVCPTTSACVPRCDKERQTLDPASCLCVELPDPTRSVKVGYAPEDISSNTGGELAGRWQFIVPEGQVLVVGAKNATINGLPYSKDWTLAAYEEFTPVDLTLDTGFYAVVRKEFAQTFFCGQTSNPIPTRSHYADLVGIPEWGNQPCLASVLQAASPTALRNAYQSPFFGYGMSWDDSWEVSRENSWWVGGPTGGFDQIQILGGNNVFALTGTGAWDGDTGACLEGAAQGIEDSQGLSNVERVVDADDAPTGRWPGREEAAVYRFHSSANGTRYAYVNCVTLPGEADTMTILFVTPA